MVKSIQIVGGYEIPIADSASLTKVAFSVDNPQIRKTDFSKSINVPATANTNKLFENLFDVNVALQTFNPNLKTSYELIIDGVSILKGYCQLKEINETDGLSTYVLNASGLIGDLFKDIGEAELTDLDFSDLDHTWNETNVVASWTPTLGTGYVYPMIRNGQLADERLWSTTDFRPAVFAKEIIDRIFAAVGYTFDSSFFDSTRFKSLILPATETPTLTDSQIEDLQFYVGRATSDQTSIGCTQFVPSGMGILIFNDDSTGDLYNTSGTDYDTTTGRFTSPNTIRYVAKGLLTLKVSFDSMSASYAAWFTAILSGATLPIIVKIHIIKNAVTIIDTIEVDIVSVLAGETITSPTYTSASFSFAFNSAEFTAASGDVIDFRMGAVELNSSTYFTYYLSSFVKFTLETDSEAMFEIQNPQILENGTMSIDSTIPKDVKQVDFLNAIIKRFNLYMQFDNTDDKELIIEPLDDFVTSDQENLNTWLDISREKKIIPLGALKDGSFVFRDKKDKDKWNEAYQTRKPHTYGFKDFDVDNEFLLNEKIVETIFAPTPLTTYEQNDRIISSIEFPVDEFGVTEEASLPRLLYWGGLLDTNFTWETAGSGTARTTYPYAGHLDDPYNPAFDLNWGVPKLLFYKTGNILQYTDKNCFNLYWKDYIEQISHKDAKMLEVYMVLDSHRYDILSFRKQYYIDGAFWRLLEIRDFDPLSTKTTKCVFILLPEVDTFTGETKVIFGGEGTFTSGDAQPKSGYIISRGGGSHRRQTIVLGDNVIAGKGSIHNSNDASSGSGNRQVFSTGSDDSLMIASKSSAINSPGDGMYRIHDTLIAGVPSIKKLEITISASEMKNLNTFPIPLAIGVDSYEYVRIERAFVVVGSTAFTSSNSLLVRTDSTNSTLASTTSSVFNTADSNEKLTNGTEVMDFGEGLDLYQATDMEGTGSSCTITLFYQIIKLPL